MHSYPLVVRLADCSGNRLVSCQSAMFPLARDFVIIIHVHRNCRVMVPKMKASDTE